MQGVTPNGACFRNLSASDAIRAMAIGEPSLQGRGESYL